MAEQQQNKPKIDLRARLGKKTVGTAGPSIPPPMATGASPSIPAPPFASRPSQPAPAFTPSTAPAPRAVEPQAIKIEMSEEVVAAQKKGKTKILIMAIAAGVVGGVIGYAFGSGVEKGKKHTIALQGAEILAGDIDKASLEINKLDETLKKIGLSLSDGEFPADHIGELSGISVPFDSSYLLGKGTNLMSAKVNDMLLDFSSQSVEANELKDEIARQLNSMKKDFEEHAKEAKNPKFHWSIYLQNGPHGPMATMQKLPEPFLMANKEKKDYKWPEEIEVPDGDKKVKLKLYKDGNPIASTPMLIPVDPSSPGTTLLDEYNVRYYELRKRVMSLQEVLKGDHSDPINETTGLVDLGKNLIDELKSIGTAGG